MRQRRRVGPRSERQSLLRTVAPIHLDVRRVGRDGYIEVDRKRRRAAFVDRVCNCCLDAVRELDVIQEVDLAEEIRHIENLQEIVGREGYAGRSLQVCKLELERRRLAFEGIWYRDRIVGLRPESRLEIDWNVDDVRKCRIEIRVQEADEDLRPRRKH